MTEAELADIEEKRRHDLDVQALVAEVRRLRAALLRYGKHDGEDDASVCQHYIQGHSCECGFEEALRSISAPDPVPPPK